MKAFTWNGTTIGTTPATQTSFEAVTNSMPGWQHSISANGTSNGIVWAARVFSGNANNAVQPGIIHAFDANNLGTELWNSHQTCRSATISATLRRTPHRLCKTVQFTFDLSNKLVVYGLLGSGPIANGTYKLICQNGGKALDNGGQLGDGTKVTQWTSGAGNINQQCRDQRPLLVCVKSGKALDNGGALTDGAQMTQWPTSATTISRWSITSVGSG